MEPGRTHTAGSRHASDCHDIPIRELQLVPAHHDPLLPEGQLAVVFPAPKMMAFRSPPVAAVRLAAGIGAVAGAAG